MSTERTKLTPDQLRRARAKLRKYVANPTHRTPVERAPLLKLKDGRQYMIEKDAGWWYVSRDWGTTCRGLGKCKSLEEVLDLVLNDPNP